MPIIISTNSTIYFSNLYGFLTKEIYSLEKDLKISNGGNKEAAAKIGEVIAKRAKDAKITSVVFDRGGYLYHGRVQALADAARQNGLEF